MSVFGIILQYDICRSSHEERGLKYFALYHLTMHLLVSLLSRGAWIEIMSERNINLMSSSLLSRGAWIEIFRLAFLAVKSSLSLLSRGAWIEINSTLFAFKTRSSRSSHEERGLKYKIQKMIEYLAPVAPLTRSVD